MRGELGARDNQLSGVTLELEKSREDQHLLKGEVKERESAIATLQTELDKAKTEMIEKDRAIANLKSESEARGGEQLLFPSTPTPELISEPKPARGTLTRGKLVDYILKKFPNSNMNGQKITDAIAGKSKNLPKFEREYGFKYLGKIKGENRFKLV